MNESDKQLIRGIANRVGVNLDSQEVKLSTPATAIAGEYKFPDYSRTSQFGGWGDDALLAALTSSPVLREVQYERTAEGGYKVRPFVKVGTNAIQDDGTSCCICGGGSTACYHDHEVKPFCVYDCVETTLDVLMENSSIVGANDLATPFRREGDSLAQIRARKMAEEYRFFFARNAILGTLTMSGNGFRPFEGIAQQVANSKVFTVSATNGIHRAMKSVECRMRLLGLNGSWIAAAHQLTLMGIAEQIRGAANGSTPVGWTVDDNGNVSYRGLRFIDSIHMPVDTAAGFGEAWLININDVGVDTIRPLNDPFIVDDTDIGDQSITDGDMSKCLEKCLYMYNGGTSIVRDYNSIVRIKDIPLDTACQAGIAGLDAFINPVSLYPSTNV